MIMEWIGSRASAGEPMAMLTGAVWLMILVVSLVSGMVALYLVIRYHKFILRCFIDCMGIRGSAVATLAVQIVAVVLQFAYFFRRDRNIRFCIFSFDKDVNREMIFNGSSEFIGEMASAISVFAFNYVLMKYVGTEGVAAFTVLGFVNRDGSC